MNAISDTVGRPTPPPPPSAVGTFLRSSMVFSRIVVTLTVLCCAGLNTGVTSSMAPTNMAVQGLAGDYNETLAKVAVKWAGESLDVLRLRE